MLKRVSLPARVDCDRPSADFEALLSCSVDTAHSVDLQIRHLAVGEPLYQLNEPKLFIYRVRGGALCVCDAPSEHMELGTRFAFPGDFLGLGFLCFHSDSARAMAETVVECFPCSEQERLAANDQRARDQLDAATEREFEHQRTSLTQTVRTPVTRIAALLLALSSLNRDEGKDPCVIEEPTDAMASNLELANDELAHALMALKNLRVIEIDTLHRLVLRDKAGLEKIADAIHVRRPSEPLAIPDVASAPVAHGATYALGEHALMPRKKTLESKSSTDDWAAP